jgi:hypothetical protein
MRATAQAHLADLLGKLIASGIARRGLFGWADAKRYRTGYSVMDSRHAEFP